MDRGIWWSIVHGVTEGRTNLVTKQSIHTLACCKETLLEEAILPAFLQESKLSDYKNGHSAHLLKTGSQFECHW